jgi:hypothetical protein
MIHNFDIYDLPNVNKFFINILRSSSPFFYTIEFLILHENIFNTLLNQLT